MSRVVIVELTVAEAKGVWQAAGEVLDHPDAALAAFPNGASRAAAGRGMDKLAAAWVRGERKTNKKGVTPNG